MLEVWHRTFIDRRPEWSKGKLTELDRSKVTGSDARSQLM